LNPLADKAKLFCDKLRRIREDRRSRTHPRHHPASNESKSEWVRVVEGPCPYPRPAQRYVPSPVGRPVRCAFVLPGVV